MISSSFRANMYLKAAVILLLCAGSVVFYRRANPPPGSDDICRRLIDFGNLAELTRQSIRGLLSLESLPMQSPRTLKKAVEINGELRRLRQEAVSTKQLQAVEQLSLWNERVQSCALLNGTQRVTCLIHEGEAELNSLRVTAAASGMSATCDESDSSLPQ